MYPIKTALFTAFILMAGFCRAQESDSVLVSLIFRESLSSTWIYDVLKQLCTEAPHRLAGSDGSLKAVQMMYQKLKPVADTVYLQEVMAHQWVRGKDEEAVIISEGKKRKIPALSLGGSVGTGKSGVQAEVIEVKSIQELKALGREIIQGKVVFYNMAMDPMDMSPGRQYGRAAWQRTAGAAHAGYYGAKAVIVRSLSNSLSIHPHTGIMRYVDSIPEIPALAISTIEAENLSRELKQNPHLKLFLRNWCEKRPDVRSYNVIAEIKGRELPEEVITVGGHIDSWDVGEGAHDDGAGCVHSMEVLRVIRKLGLNPKRTIRVVLFMDEEMYQVGARRYAQWVKERNEKIYAAIESDSGGAVPIGFACSAGTTQYAGFLSLQPLFEPYGVTRFRAGGGGVDIGFLKELNVPLMNMVPEPQRYFEFHHSANDTFDKISFRELQLGSATIAAMVVLLDKNNVF
jgi:hypothetical protein